jgi:Icc-related predicted phosphoesterase
MKFLIVGDLHGQKPKIHYKKFDAIIAPGDFCSDKPRKYIFKAIEKMIKDPDAKVSWHDLVGKKKAKQMVNKSLRDGRKILKYLDSFNVPVYIVPGNWDWTPSNKWVFWKKNYYKELIKGLKNIKDVSYKLTDIGPYQIVGYGPNSGPEIPKYKEDKKRMKPKELKKQEKVYQKKYNQLNKLFKKTSKPVIFISHNVPFKTKLDKITNKKSPKYGYHYGSVITKELVKKHQPLVCIGGHMHEHHTKTKLKKTTCINAGFGSKVNTFLELEKNKIKKLTFWNG